MLPEGTQWYVGGGGTDEKKWSTKIRTGSQIRE